ICRPGGRAPESEMVSLGDRSSAVPSVLHVGEDGTILVGDAAERRAVSEPERVAQREGGQATRIAVTHPASWGAHKKDRLGGALAAQGLPVTFLAEPQAA